MSQEVVKGYVLPGLPHPLLCPEKNPGWQKLRDAYDQVQKEIAALDVDMILIYSTMWTSILGHQIQANPKAEWVHVDEQFHDLGSIPYNFEFDQEFAHAYVETCKNRGLFAKAPNYHGFPIDTGSIVALKLLNPNNRLKASIVSSNIYADRVESIVLGKAGAEALKMQGKKAVAIVISTLSNRLHDHFIEPKDDCIRSAKDDEWNKKILEFLELGRLEDLSQLSRQIHREARVQKVVNFKSFWWLAAIMGEHNRYKGEIYAYEPVYGTGSAIVGLTPAEEAARDLEFDENSPETYTGERNVLGETPGFSAEMSSQSGDPGAEEHS